MNIGNNALLLTILRRWLISFVIVGGFMYYHSTAPILTIFAAGVGTLIIVVATTFVSNRRIPRD